MAIKHSRHKQLGAEAPFYVGHKRLSKSYKKGYKDLKTEEIPFNVACSQRGICLSIFRLYFTLVKSSYLHAVHGLILCNCNMPILCDYCLL